MVALLATGCGGGGGDGETVAGTPVLSVDPCSLLTEGDAARLTGGDVELDEGGAVGSAIGCGYRFREPPEQIGSALAASLTMELVDDEPAQALEAKRADVEAAGVTVEDVDLGDGGLSVEGAVDVQLIYVVPGVVVTIVIVPIDRAVDDALVADIVEFAETTVEPVKEAVDEQPSEEGDSTTVTAGEIEGTWTGDWGTMVLRRVGDEVHGAYAHDEGTIVGTFEDGVLTGWWTEVPSRAPPSDAGEVEFRFTKSATGIALDGRWRYGTEGEFSEDWDLELSEDPIPEDLEARFDDDAAFEEHP